MNGLRESVKTFSESVTDVDNKVHESTTGA